jgi:hypothetical protein
MASHSDSKGLRSQRIKELAARRVEVVWACVNVLRPDLPLENRKALAERFLDLGREDYRPPAPIRISPAQVQETVWRNSQCANRHCSIVLFSRELADEINEFFSKH